MKMYTNNFDEMMAGNAKYWMCGAELDTSDWNDQHDLAAARITERGLNTDDFKLVGGSRATPILVCKK